MPTKEALKTTLKEHLLYRGLRPLHHGQLGFVHKGKVVHVQVDESLYRGTFISVLDGGRAVCEFRAQGGEFDWSAIANAIVDVAEGRPTQGRSGARAVAIDANRRLANDLRSMIGPGSSSHLSIEPSPQTPGRVRVKMQEVELDPLAVLQLFAALARAIPNP